MHIFADYLLASDFDRTLTDYQGQIPQANLDAIQTFQNLGGVFTIATGRSWLMFRHIYQSIGIQAPLVLYNGAAVYDPATDHITVHRPMAKEALDFALELHKVHPELFVEFQGTKRHYCFGDNPKRLAHLKKNKTNAVFNTLEGAYEDCLNVAFFAENWSLTGSSEECNSPQEQVAFDAIEELISREYGHLVTPVHSMPRMIEMMAAGTGKGEACRRLADQLGRKHLLCVGDAPNDFTMLEEADSAFITGDCQPEMMGHGYTQVAPCTQGAIASVVERLRRELEK